MRRSREKFCSAEEEENVYVYIRIEMKRSREKFCSAGEEENVYVYILLLELNNLKVRSSRIFRVQEIEKKRIKDWEGRILQKVEDLKKKFQFDNISNR